MWNKNNENAKEHFLCQLPQFDSANAWPARLFLALVLSPTFTSCPMPYAMDILRNCSIPASEPRKLFLGLQSGVSGLPGMLSEFSWAGGDSCTGVSCSETHWLQICWDPDDVELAVSDVKLQLLFSGLKTGDWFLWFTAVLRVKLDRCIPQFTQVKELLSDWPSSDWTFSVPLMGRDCRKGDGWRSTSVCTMSKSSSSCSAMFPWVLILGVPGVAVDDLSGVGSLWPFCRVHKELSCYFWESVLLFCVVCEFSWERYLSIVFGCGKLNCYTCAEWQSDPRQCNVPVTETWWGKCCSSWQCCSL